MATITIKLGSPDEKKKVVKYNGSGDDPALQNLYITKTALKKIGNPETIKVTIEAA